MHRIAIWIGLVSGCALPLILATWSRFPAGARLGEICGVVAWMAAITAIDRRLGSAGPAGASRALRSGGLVLMVVQALIAAAACSIGLFVFYAPAMWLTFQLPLIPGGASQFHGSLVITLMCGGQVAVLAWVLGRVIERARKNRWLAVISTAMRRLDGWKEQR